MEEAWDAVARLPRLPGIRELRISTTGALIELEDGRCYVFDPRDPVARLYTVPDTGSFEPKETAYVRDFLRSGQVCVDVGASFGWYSVLMALCVGETGQVHCFEPIPHTCDLLSQNLRLNCCHNATVHEVALTDHEGEVSLFVPDIGVSGSLRLHPYRTRYDIVAAEAVTLDKYCATQGIERVDFIKADIEGGEWAMLRGAEEVLTRSRPTMLLEIQASSTRLFGYEPAELLNWLEDRGYVAEWIASDGAVHKLAPDDDPLPDYNFIVRPLR